MESKLIMCPRVVGYISEPQHLHDFPDSITVSSLSPCYPASSIMAILQVIPSHRTDKNKLHNLLNSLFDGQPWSIEVSSLLQPAHNHGERLTCSTQAVDHSYTLDIPRLLTAVR